MKLCATAFWSAPVSWRFFVLDAVLSKSAKDTGALQNAVALNFIPSGFGRLESILRSG